MRKLFPHGRFLTAVPPALLLSVSFVLTSSLIPAMAVESNTSSKSDTSVAPGDSYEQDMARAYKAFDEEDYPLAKQRYETILKKYPDDIRAIIGLARTLHRIKRISGVEPPELREVMEKVKKTVDKFAGNNDEFRKAIEESLNESVEMQVQKEFLAKKLRTGGAVGLLRAMKTTGVRSVSLRETPRPLVSGCGYLFKKDIPDPFLIPILEFDWPNFL